MENKSEKTKIKKNKGQLAVRIMASFMAIIMIFSVGISLVYYLMG